MNYGVKTKLKHLLSICPRNIIKITSCSFVFQYLLRQHKTITKSVQVNKLNTYNNLHHYMKGDFPSISLAKAVTNAITIVTAFDKVL